MKDFLDIQPKISGCNWYREIVGFAYGNTSLPGQYCNILIEKEFHLEEKHKWLSHCFEFVELAIHQSYRKQGPGKNTAKLTT
ncbi:hypothetical protein J6TS2_26590 [Heyndrickxia sporothermodurans]|nr:hypothetical protein J6TS2_26590 [Heyndrickxia sporothermodurans]